MTKRNFTLLIVIIIIILLIVFGFLFFQKTTNPTTGGSAGTNFLAQFNPFGNGNKNSPQKTPDGKSPDETPNNTADVVLKKVSSMPVAGYGVYAKERLKDLPMPTNTPMTDNTNTDTKKVSTTKPTPPPTEFMTALRYVDRATGNISETFADKIEEKKFTITTIPRVYEALFNNKAVSVVMRYLKPDGENIETFLGNLPPELLGGDTTNNNEVKGTFLPDNITDMSLSPDAQKLFYLFNLNNSVVGTVLNFSDSKKTQIFSSPFTEWLSFWPNNKIITLTTKPDSTVPGYMYSVDINTKNLSQILSNINGLTTLTSPDGKLILYGDKNGLLYIYHTDTRASDLLGVKTLPEKCVWSKMGYMIYCSVPRTTVGGNLPETWYQGEVSFTDQIWKIDMVNGNTTMIVDPLNITGGEEFDGIKLALDERENFLFFVNKKDSFLWELELSAPVPSSTPTDTTASPPKTTTSTTPPKTTPTNTNTATTTTTPTPKTYNLTIQNFTFSEKIKTINKGDTVIWTNKDSAPHNITGDNGGPASNTLNTNDTFSFTFSKAGTYTYHCSFHPTMMGTIIVQ